MRRGEDWRAILGFTSLPDPSLAAPRQEAGLAWTALLLPLVSNMGVPPSSASGELWRYRARAPHPQV